MRSQSDRHTQMYFPDASRALSEQRSRTHADKLKSVWFIMRRVCCGINIAEHIK